ncbi:39S ribosomal protein L46, mitochondrial [Ochotona curzoniae]|uniref:39S ribosomal protein L46, mitochondrial n=1 Tax=Ochotona curzoniae TaxID=130825 RepID=UPI001B3521CF|nr:39S ribosomal protein L46, mitochondrial [Ochotona curzoniae]
MAAPVKRLLLLGAGTCRLLERPWASDLASRSLTLAAPAFRSESPWHLFGAVCLQRPPLVSKPLSPLQEEMAALLRQIEIEKSLYSDHELRVLDEAQRLAKKRADLQEEEEEEEKGEPGIILAQDLEDTWEQAFLRFRPGARTTEADEKNDRTSLHRKLDRSLVLLVRQELGGQDVWMLPQAEWQPGETLRGTAERTLAVFSGNNMNTKFLGNAPCGHYKFKFPQAIRTENSFGAKVFFFKALLLAGDLSPAREETCHAWVSQEELGDYLSPRYLAQVRKFLLGL